MDVIRIENLSKLYDLGQVGTGTLSKDLNRWWARARGMQDPYARVGQRNDRTKKAEKDDAVWAIKDINFSVSQGEVVGIIGRNGAGKSTLLKIISRITTPTSGVVKVKGRIASLLEVGTGFHPEMTGRENIFMNGTLLGMTRREIQRRLDEIIDFAGVAMYVDTPVKRYSSGMQVRLAFAVAAFLEPEILIVDEVLAVGDAEFQKKAIGRMQEVSRGDGRTVLFVSHNMASIQNLCTKGVYLEQGQIAGVGNIEQLVIQYLQASEQNNKRPLNERIDRSGSGMIKFQDVTLKSSREQVMYSFVAGSDVTFILHFEKKKLMGFKNLMIALGIDDSYGNRITNLNNEVTQQIFSEVPEECTSVEVIIKKLPLMPGKYNVTIFSSINGEVTDWIQNAFTFSVEAGDFYGTGKLIPAGQGNFLIEHSFKLS